jgi:seryl-tRNA synthetase
MTPDDQITAQARAATATRSARELARRGLWRLAPGYARRRSGRRGLAVAVDRLQADFDHVSKRHGEQIERLEELARELVATAESLRREIARREPRDAD